MTDGDHRVFLDALQGVQVQFWTCPNEAHGRVTWTGDAAVCDTCGMTSEMTGRLIRAAAAYERERIRRRLVSCRKCGEIHGDEAHAEHYPEGEYDHPGSAPWQAAGPNALEHLDKLLGDGPVP